MCGFLFGLLSPGLAALETSSTWTLRTGAQTGGLSRFYVQSPCQSGVGTQAVPLVYLLCHSNKCLSIGNG